MPPVKEAKQFTGRLKSLDETGTATVVFATLETIDKDDDWIPKGAFGKQNAKISPAHNWKAPAIGVARVYEDGNEAIAELKFNLEMESAREWYQSVKFNHENGVPQEYSFGYDVKDSERGEKDGKRVRILKSLDVFEVSPVMIGAGVNTRTLDIKAYAQLQGTWESIQEAIRAAAHDLLVGDQDGWVSLQGTYSDRAIVSVYLYNEEGSTDAYYQFSWTLREDGTVALSNQQQVDLEIVVTQKGLKFSDQFARVLGEVHSLSKRQRALAARRTKEGRTLSQATRTRLGSLIADLNALLSDTDTSGDSGSVEEGKAMELYAEYQQNLMRLTKRHIGGQASA